MLVGIAALLSIVISGPALAAGILPPSNPPANIAWATSLCQSTATAIPNMGADCVGLGLSQINAARATEGVGAMFLPTGYTSLSPAQQLFVVTNLERVDRGLPAVAGMTDQLNALSAQGAGHGTDPPFPANRTWAGTVWAGGYSSTLEAVYAWMYDDGLGSANGACPSPGAPGCWGHRDIILAQRSGLTGGAATGYGSWGTEYAMEFVQLTGAPTYVYTWAQAVAQGAGKPSSVVAAPSPASLPAASSPVPAPVRPAGWPVPTRLAGGDREATALTVSQNTYAARGASGSHASSAVIARDDQFPDALAAVPLASSVAGPLLLSPQGGLDPRDLVEMRRILAPGSSVYLIGGTSALSDAVAGAVSGAGFKVSRVAGSDRFGTAVAIAHALGNPTTVLEVNGNSFADALAAGPAAAAAHGAVLLTDGSSLPAETATYLADHVQNAWAVGGPAAAADPASPSLVGGDRYQTAALVANQFIPSPSVIGVATGTAFPDALAAGAQLAQAGGALLLVRPDSVPDATAAYVAAHTTVPMLVYGGVNAISSVVTSIL